MNHTGNRLPLGIGIGVAMLAVPQILFFWLAPMAACRMAVYGFMTGFTLFHMLFRIVVEMKKGMRIAAAPLHLSTVFVMVELIACALLLLACAQARTAVYLLTVLGLVHFIAEGVLCSTLEH